MSVQGGIVLVLAALAVLYVGRKAFRNLARKGRDADCGCGEGSCCKGKAKG